MKLNAIVKLAVQNMFDEGNELTVRTRSYTIPNEEELRNAVE